MEGARGRGVLLTGGFLCLVFIFSSRNVAWSAPVDLPFRDDFEQYSSGPLAGRGRWGVGLATTNATVTEERSAGNGHMSVKLDASKGKDQQVLIALGINPSGDDDRLSFVDFYWYPTRCNTKAPDYCPICGYFLVWGKQNTEKGGSKAVAFACINSNKGVVQVHDKKKGDYLDAANIQFDTWQRITFAVDFENQVYHVFVNLTPVENSPYSFSVPDASMCQFSAQVLAGNLAYFDRFYAGFMDEEDEEFRADFIKAAQPLAKELKTMWEDYQKIPKDLKLQEEFTAEEAKMMKWVIARCNLLLDDAGQATDRDIVEILNSKKYQKKLKRIILDSKMRALF